MGLRRSAFERRSEPGVRFGWDAEREHEHPVRFGRTPFERPCRTEPTHLYSHWLLQIYMSLKPFQIS